MLVAQYVPVGANNTLTAEGALAAFARAVLAVVCLQASLLAAPAAAAGLLTLGGDRGPVSLATSLDSWLDTGGQTSVETVEAGPPQVSFTPRRGSKPQALDNAALWMRFDAVVNDPRDHWKLELPMAAVDKISLYYRNSLGHWVVQQAGDTLPMSAWPLPGRFPALSLSPEQGQPVRYYLRIEHARVPFSAVPRAVSDTQLTAARQLDHLLLGAYFGLAILVSLLALVNAVAYRDWGFASYALYVSTFAASQVAFTGIAGLYGWPERPALNNPAVFALPLAAAATAMLFVRTVTTPWRFSRALDWLLMAMCGLLLGIALIDGTVPTVESFAVANVLVSAAIVALLLVVSVSLFEGDRHARWLALGFLPIIVAALFPLARNMGLIRASFLTEHALLLGSALELPILFYGLLRRVTQRREPETRAAALRTTDPLTGLRSSRVLVSKLGQVLSTAGRYQQPCALLLINLSNFTALQQEHGRETGDRAMVMAASRIRAVAQTTDTVARVGDSQFALLMEGPMSSDSVNDVATRILASGLRPSSELPGADPLVFHIAIGFMAQPARLEKTEAQLYLSQLLQAVKDMNDGSRKAIRMIQL
ncbi:7TM diverse intracellular signaling domain-containing protein [Polaromonas sp.]|uniref:sensor domain-containing diguanylate cyclase n=1 Tax=Polaromonas sp. TaxID=1869339 RepID=UPI00375371C6